MDKKAYISPAMVSVALNMSECILDVSGKGTLGKGDTTKQSSITEGDTKASGSWGVWDDNDE